ncbi:anti-sigma factor domain-containing protein [Clostridium paridis]|uniref:Anti-sigma factor domain-containing protein n=1 Tax=Clostridium paridis TaxID=2803863 RepID=A0A937K440_9CLOT|nr:anti-sigma factor domain-containing protein [Clostridium paridis]MBL4930765.1 anti-sigma factor domain-containing protein [Clostridium paridis]
MNEVYIEKYKFSKEPKLRVINIEDDKVRGKQVFLLVKELSLYNVKLTTLANMNLKNHIRNTALNIAYDIAGDPELYDSFAKKRELPYSKICRKLGTSRTFLEIWNELITAYVIIISNPNYKLIQDYFNVIIKEQVEEVPKVINLNVFTGIVLKKSKKSAIVLSYDGIFKKISLQEECRLGDEIKGKERKSIRSYWKQLGIAAVLLIIGVSVFMYKYNKVTSILVINTTSQIKLEINSLGRVVYCYSPTEKGAELLDTGDIQNENIDNAIINIFKLAKEKKMVPDDTITIFVNGEPIEYEKLSKSQKYFTDNKLDVVINNAGYELKNRRESVVNEKSQDDGGQNKGQEATK